MPAAAAAARARSSDRLAMARSSACVVRAKAGRTRLLLLATPRMPQRNLAVVGGMTNLHFQRIVRGPDQRCRRIQSDADFHSLHEPREPPFVRKAAQEAGTATVYEPAIRASATLTPVNLRDECKHSKPKLP